MAGSRGRPLPADFVALAPWRSLAAICKHYGVKHPAARRWIEETGLTVTSNYVPNIPVPDDFAAMAPTMSQRQLALHYGNDKKTVAKWVRESGIQSKPHNFSASSKKQWEENPIRPRKSVKPKLIGVGGMKLPGFSLPVPPRDTSREGLAAETLRKYAATYRCNSIGRADPDGFFWRYGNAVLTPTELLERAERKGFQAWSIAA